MKKIKLFGLFFVSMSIMSIPGQLSAQTESFDISTYTKPKGWTKKAAESAVQFTKEDATKGTYCMITLYKSLPGTANSKENFDLAWTSGVKEMIPVSESPEMQPAVTENGWEVQSGYAPFESDGNKGIVVLVTSSGFESMVNIIIITNTDVYEKDMTAFLESISFKKPAAKKLQPATNIKAEQVKTKPVQQTVSNGFAFTTTNFDDGWVATAQADWVQVTKGTTRVLIHYPNKIADAYNSVLLDGLKNAWNTLVAPKYSSGSNMDFKSKSGWESIEYAEGDMVEKGSGKSVHVLLFKKNFSNGAGKYLEFITPTKRSFEQEFGTLDNTGSFGIDAIWDKLANMASYNKFAVAASDLTGKWTNKFSDAIQYVNANTGLDAGMNTHASVQNFQFNSNSTYNWDLGVASGAVGNIKFQSAKSNGKFSMIGNWQINFSDIEKKPRKYNVYFSCIKNFRILWLDDQAYGKVE